MIRALIIRPVGPGTSSIEDVFIESSLDALQSVVGGNIEAVNLPKLGDRTHLYINEEGKLDGLPVNIPATRLARVYGHIGDEDVIVGPCIVLGGDEDGDEADVPEWVFGAIGVPYEELNEEELHHA